MDPLLKQIIEKALEGALAAHLSAAESATFGELDKPSKNRRNGKMSKEVKTSYGQIEIESSRDRNGTFEPKLIPKWSRELGTDLEKNQANTLTEAEYALQYFADKWGEKYAQSVGTWVNNWHEIATLFEFKPPLRRLMYTTNSIEAYHRQQRKILKTKSAFVNEEALKKLLFLNMQNITQTWDNNIKQWKTILNELVDYFGERVEKYMNYF